MNAIQFKQPKNYVNNFPNSRTAKSAHLTDGDSGEVKHQIHRCNICRQPFVPEFKYQLFCGKCRSQDDSFIFNEWLPHAPESISISLGY